MYVKIAYFSSLVKNADFQADMDGSCVDATAKLHIIV